MLCSWAVNFSCIFRARLRLTTTTPGRQRTPAFTSSPPELLIPPRKSRLQHSDLINYLHRGGCTREKKNKMAGFNEPLHPKIKNTEVLGPLLEKAGFEHLHFKLPPPLGRKHKKIRITTDVCTDGDRAECGKFIGLTE